MRNFEQEIKELENDIKGIEIERSQKKEHLKSIFKDREKVMTRVVDKFGTPIFEGDFERQLRKASFCETKVPLHRYRSG